MKKLFHNPYIQDLLTLQVLSIKSHDHHRTQMKSPTKNVETFILHVYELKMFLYFFFFIFLHTVVRLDELGKRL